MDFPVPAVVRIEIPVISDPGTPEKWRPEHTVLLDRMTASVRRREYPRIAQAADAAVKNELGWCCTRTLSFASPADETSASAGAAPAGGGPPAAGQPVSSSER